MLDPVAASIYGLAVAPLALGALSVPARRALSQLPLHRMYWGLRSLCRSLDWPAPRRRGPQAVAAGTIEGARVEVWVGPDPRTESASSGMQAVWIGIRVDLTSLGLEHPPLLVDLEERCTLRGPESWSAVWQGLGLQNWTRPNDQLEIADRWLRFDRFATLPDPRDPRRLIDELLAVCKQLRSAVHPENVLHGLATESHAPAVRRLALQTLIQTQSAADLKALLLRALADPDPANRLLAASRLGADGEPVLRHMALHAKEADHRLRALTQLGRLGPEDQGDTLRSAMHDSDLRVARRAMEIAACQLGPEGRRMVAETFFEAGLSPGHLVAALEVLEDVDDDDLLTFCLELAGRGGILQVAAIDILGRRGSRECLPLIRQQRRRAPPGSSLRIACDAALDLVIRRSRAEYGQLSLTDDPRKPTGRLSLPPEDSRAG